MVRTEQEEVAALSQEGVGEEEQEAEALAEAGRIRAGTRIGMTAGTSEGKVQLALRQKGLRHIIGARGKSFVQSCRSSKVGVEEIRTAKRLILVAALTTMALCQLLASEISLREGHREEQRMQRRRQDAGDDLCLVFSMCELAAISVT